MPKEHKKRGRREEKKRKREYVQEDALPAKRYRSDDAEADVEILVGGDDTQHYGNNDVAAAPGEIQFYGLLDEEEQEYFKQADAMLELDQFADPEERSLFLANVYKEANGKELKIANSQSCSRLMERLILMSTPSQLKGLFRRFSGHFRNLAQHRFASHCCETLFLQSAPIVNQELIAPLEVQQATTEDGEPYVSMENLFLYTLNELKGNLGYLMTDPFASHTIRVLLVVLSGKPIGDSNTTSLLRSKKKENISKTVHSSNPVETKELFRAVPNSFHEALEEMISGTITQLDTTYLRALACHPVGNPVIQLLLELELSRFGKQKAKEESSLFKKLLPDDPSEEGTETVSFVNHLLYDSVGSRLLEVIVRLAPGKTFKALYRGLFQDKLGTIAKNETAGFVVIKILERLNKEDLQRAMEQLCPQISLLVERQRTSIIKMLIERCRIRLVDTAPISLAIVDAYGKEPAERLSRMLRLNMVNTDGMAEDRKKQVESQDSGKAHGSLLAQSMLEAPDTLRKLITEGLLTMDIPGLIGLSKDRTGSRVLQNALTLSDQDMKFRRVLIQRFLGHMAELASDTIASHVVDLFWTTTSGLTFIRERIAGELLANESLLRESIPGRAVWRNWKMDTFKTKKYQWMLDAKEKDSAAKTGIELARERFAASTNRVRPNGRPSQPKFSSGANGILVQGKV